MFVKFMGIKIAVGVKMQQRISDQTGVEPVRFSILNYPKFSKNSHSFKSWD